MNKHTDVIDSISVSVNLAMKNLFKRSRMRNYAQYMAQEIRKRVRLGYGVFAMGHRKERLKPLSESYVKQRRGQLAFFTIGRGNKRRVISYKPKQAPRLHPHTSPKRSNLTFTGQMLDAISGKAVNEKRGIVYLKKRRKESGIDNEQLAMIHQFERGDRPFLYMTNLESKRLRDKFRQDIFKLISTELTKLARRT